MFASLTPRSMTTIRVLGSIAIALALGIASATTTVAASADTILLPKGLCDTTVGPHTVYVAPPFVTAPDDDRTTTDTVTVRYWVRFSSATSGAVLTAWVYGGQGIATDRTSATFPTASIRGYQYGVSWTTPTPGLQAEYWVAEYRPDGTVRASGALPTLKLFKNWTVQTTWVFGPYYSGPTSYNGFGQDLSSC